MTDKPHVDRVAWTTHRGNRGSAGIDHIVMHYTTSRGLDGVIEHFMNGTPQVSAHYIIGQDGELVQMVPDELAAWHAGSGAMNRRSIGIEHCAAVGDRITPEQEATSAALIRWLVEHYNIPRENIIPHVSIKATSCPGDLFAGYGGRAGANAATQLAALRKWLAVRVFEDEKPEKEPPMTDAPVVVSEPAPMPAKSPMQSLTVWGAVITALATVAPSVAHAFGATWITPETVNALVGAVATIATIVGRFGATTSLSMKGN